MVMVVSLAMSARSSHWLVTSAFLLGRLLLLVMVGWGGAHPASSAARLASLLFLGCDVQVGEQPS